MNAQYRIAHCASSLCIGRKKKNTKKHKFLESAKWYRGTLISPGLQVLQVLSSHNFVALHHRLLLFCYLQSKLKFRNTSGGNRGNGNLEGYRSPKGFGVQEGSHSLFPSQSLIGAFA